jgi:hypothetical protein
MIAYDQEMIQVYRRTQALLKDRVTTRGVVQGNQFVFDVYGSRTDEASTRGASGDIVYGTTTQNQVTLQMQQWHAAKEKNSFNIFSSQGPQRQAMQEDVAGIINRKIDDLIIDAVVTGTVSANTSAEILSVDLAIHAEVILMNADVPTGSGVTGLLTPAAYGYLVQSEQVSSADYIDTKLFPDAPKMFKWAGIDWLVHTGLPGNATASESLYLFHKSAVGWGMDVEGMENMADYEKKHQRSWARSSFFGNAKLLQNSGVCKILHNGAGYAAA